jgi:ABC-type hemin transport system substrate-binding protein
MARSTPAALLAAALGGCGGGTPAPPPHPVAAPRVVSLSPAISRTLVDFGLQGQVVGRSAFCASLDAGIPVVGDLHELDLERLIRLHPTHLLLQPPSGAPADPELARLAQAQGWSVSRWSIDSLDDIRQMIAGLPEALFAADDPRRAEAAQRSGELAGAIATSLAPPATGGPPWLGRTLLVVATDPVLVAGRGTYLDECLAALGATNATTARGWPELSLEDVARLDPEAIVLVRDTEGESEALRAAGPLGRLDTTARRDGRIAILRHPDALLPSSAVAGVAAELAAVLARLAAAGDSAP